MKTHQLTLTGEELRAVMTVVEAEVIGEERTDDHPLASAFLKMDVAQQDGERCPNCSPLQYCRACTEELGIEVL